MFRATNAKAQNWHTTMMVFIHACILTVALFPLSIGSSYAKSDKIKGYLHQKSDVSDIQFVSTITPTPKPELILLLGGNIVEMEGPLIRPSMEEVLPISSSTIGGLLSIEANLFIKREINLTLKKMKR